jgi:prophage antirepressor-like protein
MESKQTEKMNSPSVHDLPVSNGFFPPEGVAASSGTFKKEFGNLHAINRDGEPWFLLRDVCRTLRLGDLERVLSWLADHEKGVLAADGPGGPAELPIISESGLRWIVDRLSWNRERGAMVREVRRRLTDESLSAFRKAQGSHV